MNKITANFAGQTVFVGMDIHKKSWILGIYLNELFLRNVHQSPNPQVMVNYLRKNFPGASYKATYEASKFGFWIQRQLSKLGVECSLLIPQIYLNHKRTP